MRFCQEEGVKEEFNQESIQNLKKKIRSRNLPHKHQGSKISHDKN